MYMCLCVSSLVKGHKEFSMVNLSMCYVYFVLSVPKRNAARCFGHKILDVPRVHTVPTGRHLSEIDKENDGNRDLSGVALGMHDCV